MAAKSYSIAAECTPSNRQLSERFRRNGGAELIREILVKAALPPDKYVFRIFEGLNVCAGTPKVQVRAPDTYGVIMWLKPGDSDAAVKGTLALPLGTSPAQLFDKLKAAYPGKNEPDEPKDPVPPGLLCPLLAAVRDESYRADVAAGVIEDFCRALVARLPGLPPTPTGVLELLESLADRGLVAFHRRYYTVTAAGDAMCAAAVESPAGEPAAAPPDLISLVTLNRDRLRALLDLPEKAAKLKSRRVEIEKQIAALHEELEKSLVQEAELSKDFDPEALQLLLG